MAESDSRNAGRGRIAATLADAQRTQVASPVRTAIAPLLVPKRQPMPVVEAPAKPPLRVLPQSEAKQPNPQLKVLTQPEVRVPQLQAAKAQATGAAVPLSPIKFAPSTSAPVLRPSSQMAPVDTSLPLRTTIRDSGYAPNTLSPSAGEYSYDPEIVVPEHRFLTPSEL